MENPDFFFGGGLGADSRARLADTINDGIYTGDNYLNEQTKM